MIKLILRHRERERERERWKKGEKEEVSQKRRPF